MDGKRLQALFCVFEGERTAIILCFDRSFWLRHGAVTLKDTPCC